MAQVGLIDMPVTSEEDDAREGNEGIRTLGNATIQNPIAIQKDNSRKRKQSSQHTSDIGDPDFAEPFSKRRRGIGQPRLFRLYGTSHYTLYDPEVGNVGPRVNGMFRTFAQYNEYTLFMNPAVKRVEDIPTSGIRLDDMTIAFVLTRCTQSTMRANWPAEFEYHGMIRNTRMPLGHAAKFWKEPGAIDIDGNILPEGREGYYYKWWRGIHCLCGKEGDRDVYQNRPCREKFRCPDFGFKVSSRAKIQLPSGDPEDPTFASSSASKARSSSTDSEPIQSHRHSRRKRRDSSSTPTACSSGTVSETIQMRKHLRREWKSVQTYKHSRAEEGILDSQVPMKKEKKLDRYSGSIR